jgi:hypothetical protein
VPRAVGVGRVPATTSYKTCLYQCCCGRHYSNTASAESRTCIVCSPELNVPTAVRDGVEGVLDASLNIRNLAAKRAKFCFSTSEDAVTWTVFRWLERAGQLAVVAEAAGADTPAGAPDLLLWGAPMGSGEKVRLELVSVLDELGEPSTRRSEPDVVIAWADLAVIVEVKYRSPNDVKPNYGHFGRYFDRPDLFELPPEEIAQQGLYELVRNWRIGAALAKQTGRRFALVNLGPRQLATQGPGLEATFKQSAARSFTSLAWSTLLGAARRREPFPEWLDAFVADRGLEDRWG